jgi:IS30 family transposase
MSKHLTLEEKAQIVAFYEAGFKQNTLASKYDVKQSTISRILKNYTNRGTCSRLPTNGRKKSPILGEIQFIRRKVEKNPRISSKKLSLLLDEKKKNKDIRSYS